MADARLRLLERLAATGDQQALYDLNAAHVRMGHINVEELSNYDLQRIVDNQGSASLPILHAVFNQILAPTHPGDTSLYVMENEMSRLIQLLRQIRGPAAFFLKILHNVKRWSRNPNNATIHLLSLIEEIDICALSPLFLFNILQQPLFHQTGHTSWAISKLLPLMERVIRQCGITDQEAAEITAKALEEVLITKSWVYTSSFLRILDMIPIDVIDVINNSDKIDSYVVKLGDIILRKPDYVGDEWFAAARLLGRCGGRGLHILEHGIYAETQRGQCCFNARRLIEALLNTQDPEAKEILQAILDHPFLEAEPHNRDCIHEQIEEYLSTT
jgi:hypothetical protein